jgi:peptide chain release factor 1
MYEAFAEANNFKIEVMDFTGGNMGGFKDISFTIKGTNPYGTFKYESGAMRGQRVPNTETKGRVHTSIATVIALPEVKVEDVEINKHEVKVEPYNSGGKGGQHCNKSMNAVRLTHEPTGIQASSQLKSFPQNLKLAWQVLATRIKDDQLQKQEVEASAKKKSLRGSGARNEKIRTYNWPDGRVTDHRTGKKYSLKNILEGDMIQLIEDLNNFFSA